MMKVLTNVARVLVGGLFIFSGLVKAIDPKGLAFKMQEFFEVWANSGFMPQLMKALDNYALAFSIIMITLEVVVGVALLLDWKKKITLTILLLLILFFTFLTSYVLFSGKIKACGCFGDCIPLTPIQTFTKDIILLVLVLWLLFNLKYITPLSKPFLGMLYILLATSAVLFLQWYVLRNLPLVDCLPYKPGNNIIELSKMPANAIQDKFEYTFIYEKDGVQKEFKSSPDSTWTYKDRKQVLVQKGSNNVPLINDYSLTTESGEDSTDAILNSKGEYYLLYIKDLIDYPKNWDADAEVIKYAMNKNVPIYVVTASLQKVKDRFNSLPLLKEKMASIKFLTCDATVMKTVARVNPTLYLMNGPVVKQKYSWTVFEDLTK
jgi:uncharacterized membrane protein YphA (DoxX/SURF4 family)